jgi:hypothetical protein
MGHLESNDEFAKEIYDELLVKLLLVVNMDFYVYEKKNEFIATNQIIFPICLPCD